MASEDTSEPRKGYFVSDDAARAFTRSFTQNLASIHKRSVGQFISPANVQRFRHGVNWAYPGSPEITPGEMRQHSAVAETRSEEIVDHDLSLLHRLVDSLSGSMQQQYMKLLYGTVSEACEKSGNTVSAQGAGGLEAAFLEMLEKIEFSADADGKVNMPQIHTRPEVAQKLVALEESASPEFKARFTEIKERKIALALAKEAQRKAKFVRFGEEL